MLLLFLPIAQRSLTNVKILEARLTSLCDNLYWSESIGNARWTENPLDGVENTGFRSTEFPIHQHAGLEVPRLN